jgi:hypothetical protein
MGIQPEEIIRRFNATMQKMEGSHSFHNFHKLTPKKMRRKGFPRKPSSGEEEDEVVLDDGSEDDVDVDVANMLNAEVELANSASGSIVCTIEEGELTGDAIAAVMSEPERMKLSFFDGWIARDREVSEMTRGIIYVSQVSDTVSIAGQEYVRVRIRGQAFLLQ